MFLARTLVVLVCITLQTLCTSLASAAPVPLTGVVSLSGGKDFSCAVRVDGAVYCWGGNSPAEFGVAVPPATVGNFANTAVKVAGISSATQVVSGSSHSCVLIVDRSVWCSGDNSVGQLGDGTRTSRAAPLKVNGLPVVKSIYAARSLTCAIAVDDRLWCWGEFEYTNGPNLTGRPFGALSVPTAIANLSGVRKVSAGRQHICAMTGTGSVFCWGGSGDGQIGDNGASSYPSAPERVVSLNDAVDISSGSSGACALRSSGQVVCWGVYQGYHSLGGTTTKAPSATFPPRAVRALYSDLGYAFCATDADGIAFCGAEDMYPRVAGDTIYSDSPVNRVPWVLPSFGGAVSSMAFGMEHACVLLADTSVKCWGGGYGLGRGLLPYSGDINPEAVLLSGIVPEVILGVDNWPVSNGSPSVSVEDDILLTAYVSGNAPTGTIDFYGADGTKLCTAISLLKWNGKYEVVYQMPAYMQYRASCEVSNARSLLGKRTFTTKYSGDARHTAATGISAAINFVAAPATMKAVVEFRNTPLDYYFMTSRQTDINLLDGAKASGWERTGVRFHAFVQLPTGFASDPDFSARSISRFYFDRVARNQTRGRHFYTTSDADRAQLRALNPGNAVAPGKPVDEGVDSYALMFTRQQTCALIGLQSVHRIFRPTTDDPNHRYVADPALVDSLIAQGWKYEGAAFCASR